MPVEFGKDYVAKLRKAYPQIPGRADFCVYWLRRAHDHLKAGQRAGLVGTNTIRQNYSREGGLDYIVQNGGTIVEAVSSQVWSGAEVVHVSLVNWIKGEYKPPKLLMRQVGDDRNSPWEKFELDAINSSLAPDKDVGAAKRLKTNENPKKVFVGQIHHNENFLMTCQEAATFLKKNPDHRPVIHPYLTGDDLVNASQPTRWIIDFSQRDMIDAMRFKAAFEIVKKGVMPGVLEKARREKEETGKEIGPRQNHAKTWWQFWRPRPEVIAMLETLPRYIACSRVTKRPIFEFVSPVVHPNEALVAFTFADDYSFGILQSGIHWEWFKARCSTFKADFRYTSDTVFDTFAWPQFASAVRRDISVESKSKKRQSSVGATYSDDAAPDGAKSKTTANYKYAAPDGAAVADAVEKIRAVAEAARALRTLRREIMDANNWSLRELYKSLETPGENRLRTAHEKLDVAVRAAYGMKPDEDILAFLLKLNLELAAQEAKGEKITPPGLPAFYPDPKELVTADCIEPMA